MKVENKNISEVLSKNSTSFFIPPFQRAYAWGSNEIDRYFDDLKRIIDSENDTSQNDKQEHFFGVLVFKPEIDGFSTKEVIVDGQQRLTTTLLLLIALRDLETDEKMKGHINETYLKNPSSTFTEKIKLKQVTSDWEAYKALVSEKPKISGKITNGYNRFYKLLDENGFTTECIIKALMKINVACIFLDERPYKGEDPQIIFETLNSLGKPLTLADLIRNYVLLGMNSADQATVFNEKWHPMIENIFQDKSSHFFRDYLQYKESKSHKVVSDNNTKELYAAFKDYVERTFGSDKNAFINDILRYVPWYSWIIYIDRNPKISNNFENNGIIIELLRNIFHDIEANAFIPFVLGLLEYHQDGLNNNKLSDYQLIEALSVIRTYLIRRRALKLTQGENNEIPRFCAVLRTNSNIKNSTKTELFRMLSNSSYRLRFPNDIEISNELKNMDFYNGLKKYSKFILGKIEENLSKVSVDFRNPKITIEHILPQAIDRSDAWKKELGFNWSDVTKTYLHNIGNLILTEFNSEMGKNSLEDKKKKLYDSSLLYRNDVLLRSTWNENDILSHQGEMVKRFLNAFPLPEEMRNSENWSGGLIDNFQDLISPFDEDILNVVTGTKPKAIMINDDIYTLNDSRTKTWQNVFIVFIRWFSENHSEKFNFLINNTIYNISGIPVISTDKYIVSLEKSSNGQLNIKDRFKRLSDGKLLTRVKEKNLNESYVYVHQSAFSIMQRMKLVMDIAGMPEDSVQIELARTPEELGQMELL